MGMMRVSDGVLIKWMKEVWSRICKYGVVLVDGFIRVLRRMDEMVEILMRKIRSFNYFLLIGRFFWMFWL